MSAESQAAPSPGGLFDPASRLFRFVVLVFVSLLTLGSYFAYDSLGAITPQLVEGLGISRAAVANTYTMYSVAAVVSVLVGGILTDRLGPRLASILFSSLVLLGTVVVALAPNLATLYAGRLVFGAGAESLVVAQSAIIARWFKGRELALAFGIGLTVSRLGTMFTFNTESVIAEYFGDYRYALWAAVLFCGLSWLANAVFIALDRRGERALNLPRPSAGDRIVLSDIGKFSASFWYVTILCVAFYSAVFPFTGLSTDFFHDKWAIPTTAGASGGFFQQVFENTLNLFSTAGGISSIPVLASMCLAPFAGLFVDKIGKRATLMIVGSLLIVPAHLLMGLTHANPIGPMVALGAAFVLVPAAMWPAIPLLVDKSRVGTAFGLTTMVQNVGLGLFPLLSGWLRDSTASYEASQLMFAGLGVVGLAAAVLLYRANRRAGGVLESA